MANMEEKPKKIAFHHLLAGALHSQVNLAENGEPSAFKSTSLGLSVRGMASAC